MTDEKLINLVQNTQVLYNLNLTEYSDTARKEKEWNKIGAQLQLTGSECKSRWTSLRDQYRRAMRKKATKSDLKSPFPKIWKYEEQMKFLRPYFTTRKKDSKIPEFKPSQALQIKYNDEPEQDTVSTDSDDIPKTKIKKKTKPVETESSFLMKCMVDKNQGHKEEDADDLFFKSIAKSVKNLNPCLRNLAKKKILDIVTQLEEEEMLQNANKVEVEEQYLQKDYLTTSDEEEIM